MSKPDDSVPESERPTLKFPVGEDLLPGEAAPQEGKPGEVIGPPPPPPTSNPGPDPSPEVEEMIYSNPGPPAEDLIPLEAAPDPISLLETEPLRINPGPPGLDPDLTAPAPSSPTPTAPPPPPPTVNPVPISTPPPPRVNPAPPLRTNPGPPKPLG